MSWIKANGAALIAIVIVLWIAVALVRALVRSLRARTHSTASETFSREERIRQEIRRKVADRKLNPVPLAQSPTTDTTKPGGLFRPIDPFGGPTRRLWVWLRSRLGRNDGSRTRIASAASH